MEFEWDQSNQAHIALHGISRLEVERVLIDPLGEILDWEIVSGETRYRQIGCAPGGRILVVIFEVRGTAVRPVTAFDATRFMARRYREGSRR